MVARQRLSLMERIDSLLEACPERAKRVEGLGLCRGAIYCARRGVPCDTQRAQSMVRRNSPRVAHLPEPATILGSCPFSGTGSGEVGGLVVCVSRKNTEGGQCIGRLQLLTPHS